MKSVEPTYEEYLAAERAYRDRFGFFFMNGIPQAKSAAEAIEMYNEAIRTGVEIVPEYDPNLVY